MKKELNGYGSICQDQMCTQIKSTMDRKRGIKGKWRYVYIYFLSDSKQKGEMEEEHFGRRGKSVRENKRKKELEVSRLNTQFPILIVQQTVQSASSRFASLSLSRGFPEAIGLFSSGSVGNI